MKRKITINDISVTLTPDGPAPAWTEGGVIYIREGANQKEQQVLLRHELGHLLLLHEQKTKEQKLDPRIANMAGDAEIAIAIYDDEDEEVIQRPRSVLTNGIDKAWAEEHAPNATTFEEIYKILIRDQKELSGSPHCTHGEEDEDKVQVEGLDDLSQEEIAELTEKLEKELFNIHQKHKLCKAPIMRRQKGFNDIVADIAREAILRRRTYRRPSRRLHSEDMLRRGVRTTKSRPKVTVYVDRSGSFTPEKTEDAEKQMRLLAQRYEAKLNIDVLFFSDELSKTSLDIVGGGTNYPTVVDHIIRTQPRIAVVITDDDGCADVPVIPKTVNVFVKLVGCTSSPFAQKVNAIVI